MSAESTALYITAASIGFLHTLLGPDHYLPFIVMGRAREWSLAKTSFVTFFCGLGHVASSIILGIMGILLGIGVMKLETLEAARGNLAGWALIAFGFAYFVWGLRSVIKNRPHKHVHLHGGLADAAHLHEHTHTAEHAHIHYHKEGKANITPWILFTIFVLGPCEPLIPILMYPAAKMSVIGVMGVASIFGVTTIMTMLTIVIISSFGINLIPLGRLERYGHALAGATICLCGIAIQFLGL